jgi:transaldolase/glucose-6-phosphate isomerase
VTSKPAVFEEAVAGSAVYRGFREAPDVRVLDAKTLYEKLAVRGIQDRRRAAGRVRGDRPA